MACQVVFCPCLWVSRTTSTRRGTRAESHDSSAGRGGGRRKRGGEKGREGEEESQSGLEVVSVETRADWGGFKRISSKASKSEQGGESASASVDTDAASLAPHSGQSSGTSLLNNMNCRFAKFSDAPIF